MLTTSFPPGRSCARMLGTVMHIIHRMGWPLHVWPCKEVGWLMCTAPRRHLLMVRLEARCLRCSISVLVAIAVALVCIRSTREAMMLWFCSILGLLLMSIILQVGGPSWTVRIAIWLCWQMTMALARLSSSWPEGMGNHVAASGCRIAIVVPGVGHS